ncbi:MAG: MBL fold metallo-hydrolase [Bacteroidota bacterium]
MGTGTSQGVPVIGCDCPVCRSADPRDQRLRTSVLISNDSRHVVIDTGPDFRQQMLRTGLQQLEAVLLTHEHNDHVIGLDDVRPFNFRAQKDMPVFAMQRVLNEVKSRFRYIFESNYPGVPRLELQAISEQTQFELAGMQFQPILVWHGKMSVLGFRIGEFTYITDAKTIDEPEFDKIKGTRYLVLNALHHREHHSHLNLNEALDIIHKIQPEKAFLTHVSHHMGLAAEMEEQLPANVQLAYDGQELWFTQGR